MPKTSQCFFKKIRLKALNCCFGIPNLLNVLNIRIYRYYDVINYFRVAQASSRDFMRDEWLLTRIADHLESLMVVSSHS